MDDDPSIATSPVARVTGSAAPRTLVMWSGGLDSTYALWRLEREKRGALYSHHVRIGPDDGDAPDALRARMEAQAVRALRAAMTGGGEDGAGFTHSESSVALPAARESGGRAAILVFHAARVMAALGFTSRDRLVLGANGDVDPGWQPDTAAFALRRLLVLRLLRAAAERDDVPRLALLDPLPKKRRMLEALPPALQRLVASCLEPRCEGDGRPRACGACAKCRWRAGSPVRGGTRGDQPRPARPSRT